MSQISDVQKIEFIGRLAKLLANGVSQKQAAEALGVSEGWVSQVKEEEAFQTKLQEECAKIVEGQINLTNMWDKMEEVAVKGVLDHMKFSKNPDYLLRAALTANRATRRTRQPGNETLNVPGVGSKVSVTLSKKLIQRLTVDVTNQQVQSVPALAGIDENQKKVVSMMPAPAVQKMFERLRADAVIEQKTEINLDFFDTNG